MGAIKRLFVPFGELKPDGRLFNNDGLVDAVGVVPVYGNYIGAPVWLSSGDTVSEEAYGLHTHFAGGSVWYAYLGVTTKLYEFSSAFAKTDKTRAAGGAYTTGAAGSEAGWQHTSFGSSVVMTNYVDDPQLLTSPASANFVKLASSAGGSAGTGMDPKAKFVAPVRNNLFLANLNLPTALLRPDATTELAAGAYPAYVCWSQSDNVRQYGSFTATPNLTGTGYQPLTYDLGDINGMVGGDYALMSLQKGWVRCDGPPYTFRPIVVGQGCRFPNSIIRFDNDVYYWGPSGPSVLRGGEGPPEVLGDGKIARTLIDNATGFSPTYSVLSSLAIRHISAGRDVANGLVFWSYTDSEAAAPTGNICVIYNVREGRFSFMENGAIVTADNGPFNPGMLFLQNSPDLGGSWSPGRDLVGVMKYLTFTTATAYALAVITYTAPIAPSQWGGTSPLLTRAYQQVDSEFTTRIRRVRPVFSQATGSVTFAVSVTVYSKNKPYDTAVASTPSSAVDAHGWTPTTDSKYADFHQVRIQVTGTHTEAIAEFEGYEIEYETGGRYAA